MKHWWLRNIGILWIWFQHHTDGSLDECFSLLRERRSLRRREQGWKPPPSPPNLRNKIIRILGGFGPRRARAGPVPQKLEIPQNSVKLNKIPEISQISVIFAKYREFRKSSASGPRFPPMLQNVAIIKRNGMHFWSFSPESRFFAKRRKFRKFLQISPNFEEFQEIW